MSDGCKAVAGALAAGAALGILLQDFFLLILRPWR